MGFNTIDFNCNFLSSIKDDGKDSDILNTFNLSETPGYMIINFPTYDLYQNVTKYSIENIEFSIKDEYVRVIDFIGDVLSFTLHLV